MIFSTHNKDALANYNWNLEITGYTEIIIEY